MSNHKGSAPTPRDELGELTPLEVHIITELRQLNSHGQSLVLTTTENLVYSGRHRAPPAEPITPKEG